METKERDLALFAAVSLLCALLCLVWITLFSARSFFVLGVVAIVGVIEMHCADVYRAGNKPAPRPWRAPRIQ
jgi:uncharacterized membrane protein HdeD (DUF308 family)